MTIQFEAHTNSASIGMGTVLTILHSMQMAGDSAKIPSAGDPLSIEMSPPGTFKSAEVVSANWQSIVIKLDGSTWTMTPATPSDPPGDVPAMSSSVWVIRQ